MLHVFSSGRHRRLCPLSPRSARFRFGTPAFRAQTWQGQICQTARVPLAFVTRTALCCGPSQAAAVGATALVELRSAVPPGWDVAADLVLFSFDFGTNPELLVSLLQMWVGVDLLNNLSADLVCSRLALFQGAACKLLLCT